MRKYFYLSCIFVFVNSALNAQEFNRLHMPFSIDGVELANPLTGGLNSPQLSAVDLDEDGIEDLYIFDRVGNQQLTFLSKEASGGSAYIYAPEFAANFPELINWVLLRDYNRDGIMDIFAYSDTPGVDGVIVFSGYYEEGKIAFERFHFDNQFDLIFFPLPSGGQTQLFVSKIDYPAIDDIDCDGDLDILTFNVAGGFVELYANQSIEMGFGTDSLLFELADNCWGGFFESGISSEIELSSVFGECIDNLVEDPIGGVRHAGSTLMTFDADNDGDRELVLGDVSFSNLNFLLNGGDCQMAWSISQDFSYPSNSLTVDIPVFPASFFLDVNKDGKKDLLAAPNASQNAEDYLVLWFYENVESNELPQFEFRKKDFLLDEMVDLGSGSNPVFTDYNADGLLDIVAGNFSFFKLSGEKDARLFLFENTGTSSQPRFELVDDDYLGMSQFSQNSHTFAPTFGDLDNDSDPDLLVGEEFGKLFYAENLAGAGNPMQFGPFLYGYQDIDVGLVSTPQIIDLNRDGLPDLIVGERNGNINYFQNTGTPEQAQFNPDPNLAPNTFFLGQVDTRIPGFVTGYSSPLVLDLDGEYRLFTGTEIGRIEVYSNIENNIYGAFDLDTETFGEVYAGKRTQPAFADIDRDGLLDMLLGNFRGGLSAFTTGIVLDPVATAEVYAGENFRLSPNPAGGSFSIELPANIKGRLRLQLYNTAGKVVLERNVMSALLSIDVSALPSGLYFARISSGTVSWTKKVIVGN